MFELILTNEALSVIFELTNVPELNLPITSLVPETVTDVPEVPAVPELPDVPLVPELPDVPLVPDVADAYDRPPIVTL